jgi:flagellar biosynthesis protein FlhF
MRVVNQITFEAKDDAEALRLAGERLGKEAVILSSRTVHTGGFLGFFQRPVLLVSAGILQDEQPDAKTKERGKDEGISRENLVAFQKLLELKQAADVRPDASPPDASPPEYSAAEKPPKVIYSPTSVASGNGRTSQVVDSVRLSSAGLSSAEGISVSAAARQDGDADAETLRLREEVASLSERLDKILRRFEGSGEEAEDSPSFSGGSIKNAENAKNFSAGLPGISETPEAAESAEPVGLDAVSAVPASVPPEEDEFYRKLLAAEVDPLYARRTVEEYRESAWGGTFSEWLETKVLCAAGTPLDALGGRKVMLIGPTGVGKTTTIAKLAAIQALWEHKRVLLLTSDTYRIAAVDQLRTYAKILGVPIEVIYEVENFPSILEEYADSELILLDTAGRGQKDRKNLDTCEILYEAFKPDAVHLVLSANMKYRDMQDIIERMSVVPISHVIFTKMDETVSYGALFNVMKLLERPLSFLTTGQNVPNDIEVASGPRFVSLLMEDGRGFR